MHDFLKFLTGSRFIDKKRNIVVKFTHPVGDFEGRNGPSLVVNTCDFFISFPVVNKYVDEETFRDAIIDDIINSPGFTRP